MELVASASPDLMTGRCSNYSCPTRAPRKVKLKVGGYANLPGQSTFTRKRI